MTSGRYVIDFADLRMSDVARVGGKNASLGEMIGGLAHMGVRVPGGFATTADAYREFLAHGGLDRKIEQTLEKLDVDDVKALAEAGAKIREWIVECNYDSARHRPGFGRHRHFDAKIELT